MLKKITLALVLVAAAGGLTTAAGQTAVKHLQTDGPGGIASGVWAGDTFYLSGPAAFAGDPRRPRRKGRLPCTGTCRHRPRAHSPRSRTC